MPAYFSVYFELEKTKTAIGDFYKAAIDSGLAFKRGFEGNEGNSLADVIAWNQSKLDENFQLRLTDDFSKNFKLSWFDFSDFTEVGLGVINNKRTSTFRFQLIIPEDDFLDYVEENDDCIVLRKEEKMDFVKSFARSMWNRLDIVAIQTAWECSDYPPRAKNISRNKKPQSEPFCIIKKASVAESLGLPFEKIEKNGFFIEDRDNWLFIDFTDLSPIDFP